MDFYYKDLNVCVHLEIMGEDLCVSLYGGNRAHVGSVAIAEPRPSLTGDGTTSSTVSTYTFVGHKDDEVANYLAKALSSGLARRTVVVCGLHYDEIDEAKLAKVRQLTETILQDLMNSINQH